MQDIFNTDYQQLFNDEFPKEFYNFIYGTIHHHAYAEGRANELIRMFGKGKYLEIGAGCGILVKALRDLGCEAWGIEISDYALSEKCTEFLIKGDMRDIPFPNDSFDVVHSWAVFGYVDEEGTGKAIEECKRVGKRQYHTIDFQIAAMTPNYPYGYVFMQPREWWDERIENEA